MKAKQLLQYVNELFPDIVAITKDFDGEVYFYNNTDIEAYPNSGVWRANSNCNYIRHNPLHNNDIEWESKDWTKCIETLTTSNNEN